MNIKHMVGKVIARNNSRLGGESVDFAGTSLDLILSESRIEKDIYGGTRYDIQLTGVLTTTTLTRSTIKPQGFATVRGVSMKIQAVRVGDAITEVEFEEANKIQR